ncbi:putative Ig domain-containing protein [Jatrophihabitans sp.]|uniref:putative Ig domain-containing protein n=1 Tax=Jatrophihabitans sp. TaxID=1932789 RepID=UPI0038CD7750
MAALGLAVPTVTGLVLTTGGPATAAPGPKASPNALAAQSAAGLVAARPAAIHASKDDTFIAHPVISTREGLQYVPYTRTYKGLPVYGGDFVVTTDATGKVLSTSVAQHAAIDVSTAATQSPAQAANTARGRAAGKVVDSAPAGRKVVYALSGTPRLAYETVVSSHTGATLSTLHVFTDASTGTVLYSYDEVREGSGTGRYNGPSPLTIDTSHPTSTTWTMTDPTRSNVSCRTYPSGAPLSGTDDVWGNGVGTNLETACVDALFALKTEWTMLSNWLGRNGINGSGGGFPIYVGLNDINAYWNGSSVAIGHNNAGEWITSLDVVAHEFGHAIDATTPGNIGSSSVAEFTGDVFGALTERYANEPATYDPPDYTVGEEVNLTGNGPIRYMYNPSLAGDPNCYSSAIPSTETHSAAGPGNHWFYLASEGSNPANGQPASPTCNGSTVTGIGIQTVGKIFYNAMLAKTTGMTYLQYRVATLNAAKNLYPGSCTNFNAIKAAWNAVSVPAQTGEPTCTASAVVVTNPGAQTGTVGVAKSLTMTASGGTAPYTWSATGLPPGKTINASTGVISGAPTTAGSYTSTVTAKASTNATGSVSFSWTISGSGALSVSSPGALTGYVGISDDLFMGASGGTTPYTWSATGLPPGKTINASSGRISGAPYVAGSYGVRVTATDSVGASDFTSFTWTVDTGPLTVYPRDQKGVVGTADSVPLVASGGTGPYTWSATGLPPGFDISADDSVSGTPTTAGTYSVTITATDAANTTASATFSWFISGLHVINPGTQRWEEGIPVNLQMQAADGASPYTWSATGLPSGVSISSTTGLISGTPTGQPNHCFCPQVSARDSTGVTASTTFSAFVASPLDLPPIADQTAVVGQPYQYQVSASFGVKPYTFSAGIGLPAGLTITPDGLISGTPTTAGRYLVSIRVTDNVGATDTRSATWTVT